MALRFGPKQAIDAFLLPLSEDPEGSVPDPREPPHPDPNLAAADRDAFGVQRRARADQRPVSRVSLPDVE